jgi:predicted Rossmann-fold nucleotide-binding protein
VFSAAPVPAAAPSTTLLLGEMGAELVRSNIGLVYGGGNVGLMGVLTDAVLRTGGPRASTASRLP